MKKTRLKKQSSQPTAKLKRKLLDLAKAFVRERDGVCQAAEIDGRKCWGYLSASHIYPEGTYHGHKFDPLNMKGLCNWHHIYWWHKNPAEAGKWIEKYLGKRFIILKKRTVKIVKWKDPDLKHLIGILENTPSQYPKEYGKIIEKYLKVVTN